MSLIKTKKSMDRKSKVIPSKQEQEQIASLIALHKEKFARTVCKTFYSASKEDIEDCFSELYIKTWENYTAFKDSPNKAGWLFLTVRNIVSDRVRENNRQAISAVKKQEQYEEYYGENDIIFGILTNHLSESELKELILDKLSEKDRLLYRLRFEKKLDTKEIAKQIGLANSTVRRQVRELRLNITDLIYSEKLFELIKEKNL